MDKDDLGKKLKQMADDAWKSKQAPVLLSMIPAYLKQLAPEDNYRTATEKLSLKAFILQTGSEFGYQLIEHPTQRATLGLVPAEVKFSFSSEPKSENIPDHQTTRTEEQGIALLRMLAKLPDVELDKVVIPVSVLAKLFR
ncbi:MAG: hypothetical protein EG824_00095 [Deltaproteobacteria bacterium]|nr:hypothetical protein [Deltaproteobacteria bacterium]